MRGIETHGFETVILFIAVALIIGSFVARFYIFRKLKEDHSVQDLLANASIIGSDLLAIRLIRRHRMLSSEAKTPVFVFSSTQILGVVLLLLVASHAILIGR